MSKRIFIVSSTPRKGGNSEILAEEFARGAKDCGHEITLVKVRDLNLKFCTGCMYCATHDGCAINDDMNALYVAAEKSDVVVFATPVYYYSVSGQLKTFLDRLNPLYPRENKFRKVYLLATAADGDENAVNGSVSDIQGWADCFDGVEIAGVLRAVGVENKGDVKDTNYPAAAYEMGRNV